MHTSNFIVQHYFNIICTTALPGHRPWENTWWSYGTSILQAISCVFVHNKTWWRDPLAKSLVVCDTPSPPNQCEPQKDSQTPDTRHLVVSCEWHNDLTTRHSSSPSLVCNFAPSLSLSSAPLLLVFPLFRPQ